MMFKGEFLNGIAAGEVTRTYRRWKRPQVKQDGIYQLYRKGAIQVTDIGAVTENSVTDSAARLSGFDSATSLLDYLGHASPGSELYCVKFRYIGEVRKKGPDQSAIDSETEWQTLADKLAAKDRSSAVGPWTLATLTLIGESPGTSSKLLAASLKRIQMDLKKDIRKLKQLGLTISLETGYKLSDRGRSYLDRERKV
jgi:hypothetical protein